jgi:hypothetical protein
VNNRIWILGTAIVCVGAILLGWFIGIQPRVNSIAANSVALVEAQGTIEQNRAKLETLKQQFSQIDEVRTELAALRVSLPADGAYQSFIDELSVIASESNATFTGYTWSAPSYYVAPADAKGDKAAVPTNPNSLLVIPITIQAKGSTLKSVLDFLHGVEFGDRLVSIGNCSFEGKINATKGITYTLNMETLVYSLVDPASFAQAPETDVPTPAPTGTPVPTPTGSSTSTPAPTGTPAP